MNKKIDDFLQVTEYCDHAHPEIQNLAYSITKDHDNDKAKAIAVFEWVRDNILYRLGMWNRKASETLAEGEGSCSNKSNLMVALLRASNIPSGYGLLKVNGQKYWGPIAPPILYKHIGKVSNHVYAMVYINKWIAVDPSDDRDLCENISYINPLSKLIEWDGSSDAKMPFDDEHVYKDIYPLPSIDHVLSKEAKNAKGLMLEIFNIFVRYVRVTTRRFNNTYEIQKGFLRKLKKKNIFYYYFVLFASKYKYINDMVKTMTRNLKHQNKNDLQTNVFPLEQQISEQQNEK